MTSRQMRKRATEITSEKIVAIQKGRQLSPGVMVVSKVYITAGWLSVSDKVAGRHRGKGVIAHSPEEDMPAAYDGTPA